MNHNSLELVIEELKEHGETTKDLSVTVDAYCGVLLDHIVEHPGDWGLAEFTSIQTFRKDEGGWLTMVKGKAKPGNHKIVCYTDSMRPGDGIVQLAFDCVNECVEWKPDEGKKSRMERSSFYDTFGVRKV